MLRKYQNNTNYRSVGTLAITVYDVELKKPVLVFKSSYTCIKYVYKHGKQNKDIINYINKKRRSTKNTFNKIITFRYSTLQQKQLLGDQEMIILDQNYKK